MNFLELIFTVCAVGNAAMCQDKHIALEAQLPLSACVTRAQPTLAQWVDQNPNWTIMRWHCEYSGNTKQKA